MRTRAALMTIGRRAPRDRRRRPRRRPSRLRDCAAKADFNLLISSARNMFCRTAQARPAPSPGLDRLPLQHPRRLPLHARVRQRPGRPVALRQGPQGLPLRVQRLTVMASSASAGDGRSGSRRRSRAREPAQENVLEKERPQERERRPRRPTRCSTSRRPPATAPPPPRSPAGASRGSRRRPRRVAQGAAGDHRRRRDPARGVVDGGGARPARRGAGPVAAQRRDHRDAARGPHRGSDAEGHPGRADQDGDHRRAHQGRQGLHRHARGRGHQQLLGLGPDR